LVKLTASSAMNKTPLLINHSLAVSAQVSFAS
jgi:hypothetical protein